MSFSPGTSSTRLTEIKNAYSLTAVLNSLARSWELISLSDLFDMLKNQIYQYAVWIHAVRQSSQHCDEVFGIHMRSESEQ